MNILVNPFEEANRLATERGDWIVAAVETQVFWPGKKQVVFYDSKTFMLLPLGEPIPPHQVRQLPAIALRADAYGLTREQARREIMRFASALSWRERGKIEIVSWTGGNIPRSMGIMRNNTVTDYMSSEYLPTLKDETSATALAFYREGMSLDNPFYAFLSFYKAFTVAVPDGRTRGDWLSSKRVDIKDPDAKRRLEELESQGVDVSIYLYDKGRHAIAHADREPHVNSDSTDDHFRLSQDLPLMRNFAELAIEIQLGIKSISTIHREHLYELEGFRNLMPKEKYSINSIPSFYDHKEPQQRQKSKYNVFVRIFPDSSIKKRTGPRSKKKSWKRSEEKEEYIFRHQASNCLGNYYYEPGYNEESLKSHLELILAPGLKRYINDDGWAGGADHAAKASRYEAGKIGPSVA
jgi:hypothetical protein